MRVRIYLDGLNFYHRIAVQYNFKWIDLEGLFLELVRKVEPQAVIEKVFIFTSEVIGDETPKDARWRQRNYLEALKQHSDGKIEFVLGFFTKKRTKKAAVASRCCAGDIKKFKVREEKCTDVNLACQMVEDAYTVAGKGGDFDVACLVSNDADMSAALKVKRRLQQKTLLITPRPPESDIECNSELTRHIPKANRISSISENLVLEHHLPAKVGEYEPPDSEGWSIEEAQKRG